MTFDSYGPLTGRTTGRVYPPVAPIRSVPERFERYYEGSSDVEVRIRRAITAYAVRTWTFWQSSVYLVSLCVIVGAAIFKTSWGYYPPLALFTVVMAGSVPVYELRDIRKLAKNYSNPHATYAASFTPSGFVWQSTAGTFEIAWDSISKTIRRDNVTILALKNSRAIAVLPDELLTIEAGNHLKKMKHPV
jgi:hypothetical protein